MTRRRKFLLAIVAATLLLAGCGAIAHHSAAGRYDRQLAGYNARRHLHLTRVGLCAYHGTRLVSNIKHAHPGWAAWQVYRAAKTCRGFRS